MLRIEEESCGVAALFKCLVATDYFPVLLANIFENKKKSINDLNQQNYLVNRSAFPFKMCGRQWKVNGLLYSKVFFFCRYFRLWPVSPDCRCLLVKRVTLERETMHRRSLAFSPCGQFLAISYVCNCIYLKVS